MNIGIIGYGSMGKMIADKLASTSHNIHVSNRNPDKLKTAPSELTICDSNRDLASKCDVVILCVRPGDIRDIIIDVDECLSKDSVLVSLNGSVTFGQMKKVTSHKMCKVIPSVTAEIDRSQTLVCHDDLMEECDKKIICDIFSVIGNVIELSESEMGMGSELVSCMPGFIASIFDVICTSAQKHTSIPQDQIVRMVLNTMSATGDLMIQKDMTFDDVVTRVATPGGITRVGADVVYEKLPQTADELFEKTLQKRKITAQKAGELFG